MHHVLTALRLLLAAPVAWGVARPGAVPGPWLLAAVLVAVATDYLDGIVARHAGAASDRGRLYDHSVDFVFVVTGLAAAAYAGEVPALLPLLVVAAFTQYVVDSYALHRAKRLRMSSLGRVNGVLYFLPIVLVAALRWDVAAAARPLGAVAVALLSWLLVGSTIASMIDRALAPRAEEDARRLGRAPELTSRLRDAEARPRAGCRSRSSRCRP